MSEIALAWWTEPVELAPRVWWVGAVRPDETFQCHAYLIEAGDQSVLIDPGSADVIDEVLAKVAKIVPIDSIRWVVCHHSDPDIAAGLPALRIRLERADVELVTEWRAQTLLHHYHAGFPFYRVEEHGWRVPLDGDRELCFALTPYLHFPGAMCSWDASTGVLFSSDLFGGFTDGQHLVAEDMGYFEAMRPFHEHYMPSKEILAAGLDRIRRSFSPITLIAPQHGCVIPGPLVDEMFIRLAELECGIFLIARDDIDIARLLRLSSTVRHMTDALVMAHDLRELARIAQRVMPELLPIETLEIFVDNAGEGTLRFSIDDDFTGTAAGMPDPSTTSLVLPIGGDGPNAVLHITLRESVEITHEMEAMFLQLAPALRVAINRHLEQLHLQHERTEWMESASHDPLTGLYNRAALKELAKEGERFGVLMIDIDHFKRVNDDHGHLVGDRVLRDVATACRNALRATDRLFRYGGEEMLALIDSADQHEIAKAAERVRRAISELTFDDLPGPAQVTVSIGASMHQQDQTVSESINQADQSLYTAKNEGRNQVALAWPS